MGEGERTLSDSRWRSSLPSSSRPSPAFLASPHARSLSSAARSWLASSVSTRVRVFYAAGRGEVGVPGCWQIQGKRSISRRAKVAPVGGEMRGLVRLDVSRYRGRGAFPGGPKAAHLEQHVLLHRVFHLLVRAAVHRLAGRFFPGQVVSHALVALDKVRVGDVQRGLTY